jgi:hypothetical protein
MDPRSSREELERLAVVLADTAYVLDDTAGLLLSVDRRLALLRDAIIQHRATVGDEGGAADFKLWAVLDDDDVRRERCAKKVVADDGA